MTASEAGTALPKILAVRLAQTGSLRARLPAGADEEGQASACSSSFFHQCSLIARATARHSRLWFAPGRPRTLPVLPRNRAEALPHVSPLRPHRVSLAPLLLCV